jgi:hypothetical protein
MFTIKKDNLYVKASGMGGNSSYTTNINKAVKYNTEEEAKKNACGNETVVKLSLVWGE